MYLGFIANTNAFEYAFEIAVYEYIFLLSQLKYSFHWIFQFYSKLFIYCIYKYTWKYI